jgi:nucleoid-associated protein YgaU
MWSRSLIFTIGGLAAAAIVAAGAYWLLVVQPRGAPPVSVVTATFAPTAAAGSPAAAPTAAPRPAPPTAAAAAPSPASTPAFDVVRVEPNGDAVVAGRAAPGAQVDLSDDGKAIGDAVANDAGQFVILPAPLSPGRHPLRLSAKVGGGAPQVSDVVVVEVAGTPAAVAAAPAAKPSPAVVKPAPQPTVATAATPTPAANAAPTPTPAASAVASTPAPAAAPRQAAASPPAAPPAAASPPAPTPAAAPAPTATIVVAIANVRPVDPAGLEVVGVAPPGARVRLRLNNAVLAEVVAGADGEWRLTIERGVTAGDYVLEAAVVDPAGTVLARAESPFVYPQREVVASAAPAASPSPTESPQAAAAEPAPAASALAATAEPRPSPTAANVAPPPTAVAGPTRAAPTPAASVAAAPSPATPAPAQTLAASETPVATAAHAVVPEVLTYTVVKGDNLWDLAVKYYGDGLRYADIFSANASQIRDPNLIYIGQIFVVPAKPATNPPPAR